MISCLEQLWGRSLRSGKAVIYIQHRAETYNIIVTWGLQVVQFKLKSTSDQFAIKIVEKTIYKEGILYMY